MSRPVRSSLVLAALFAACGAPDRDPEPTPKPDPFTLEGTWADGETGGSIVIGDGRWGTAAIAQYDNAKRFVVLQNPANESFHPSKFGKVVWTAPKDGQVFYCWVDFGRGTAEEAAASTATADDTSPTVNGCGGYPWKRLVQPIELVGSWDDDWESSWVITALRWGPARIAASDNAANVAILQNAEDDEWSPNTFSKVVWTELANDSFWMCWVDFGKATAAEAATTDKTADASNPAEGGCGGSPWTKMTRRPAD